MTRITFRLVDNGQRSVVSESWRKYLDEPARSLLFGRKWIDAEMWRSTNGFLVRLSSSGHPFLLYAASPHERVVYGFGTAQASVGVRGFGEGVVLPVLSDEMTTDPLYFQQSSGRDPARGERCREVECRNVYVSEQHGGHLRLTHLPHRIGYDFLWFHGAYQKVPASPTVWAYQETDADHPETSVRTEVRSVVTAPDRPMPDWQALVPKGITVMATDGRDMYGLPGANGVPPGVRFEKQERFYALREAATSATTHRNLLAGGLALAAVVAGVLVARSIAKSRRVR